MTNKPELLEKYEKVSNGLLERIKVLEDCLLFIRRELAAGGIISQDALVWRSVGFNTNSPDFKNREEKLYAEIEELRQELLK
jgi:hypothetical protein